MSLYGVAKKIVEAAAGTRLKKWYWLFVDVLGGSSKRSRSRACSSPEGWRSDSRVERLPFVYCDLEDDGQ